MIFEPLDDVLAEILAETTNQILETDLKQVIPDGIKSLYVKPAQIQAMFKAITLYNIVAKRRAKC